MRTPKTILGISLLIISLAINGCTLFPSTNKTRPAPTRPKMTSPTKRTPSDKVRPAPTKRTPAISSMTEKEITDRLTKIDASLKKDDWAAVNKETNSLGGDMLRFRPTGAKGKSLRETANFDTLYAKLQADVKTKNKTAVMNDVKNLQNSMGNIKTSKS
ncbi:MAG TPA: hypothetical protein DDW65_08615 [Firmicutes bacterium]|nr:hypothetical protein [Bacillota bacterium]